MPAETSGATHDENSACDEQKQSEKSKISMSAVSESSQNNRGQLKEDAAAQPENEAGRSHSTSVKSSLDLLESLSKVPQQHLATPNDFENSAVSECDSSRHPENSVDESAAYKADEEEDDSPAIPSLNLHEAGETSELPSCYWRPAENESRLDIGQSHLDLVPGRLPSQCHSYVAGHVDSLSAGSNCVTGGASLRPSDIATATSQSSCSPASTVRENTDFRSDSLCVSVSEPQLSSTREITDDCIDLGLCGPKRVHFNAESQQPQLPKPLQLPFQETLLDATPNLCSTARSYVAVTPAQNKMCTPTRDSRQELTKSALQMKSTEQPSTTQAPAGQEWHNVQNFTLPQDQTGFTPDSWVAVFSNTSALSTPGLMNKIKDHVLRLNGQAMHSLRAPPSESSGIGESGFDITENSNHVSVRSMASISQPPSEASTHSFTPASVASFPQQNASTNIPLKESAITTSSSESKSNGRHTIAALPIQSIKTGACASGDIRSQTPVNEAAELDFKGNGFTRLTSTVMKKVPPTEAKPPAVVPNFKGNSMDKRPTFPSEPTVAKKVFPTEAKPPTVAPNFKGNLMDKRPTLPSAPIIKCNRTHIHFGGAKVRQSQKQFLVIRNSSFTAGLDLELRIKDSEDFYIVSAHQSMISRHKVHLDPRQELSVELVFQPQSLGRLNTKLNLYPRCEAAKKVKYTVDLSGYGGSSLIHVGPEQTLAPKSSGTFWRCRFVLENRGNVAGFVFIQPLKGNILLTHYI